MKVKTLSADDITKEIVKEFGFNPENITITSIEVLSCLVRRTSGLLCPCSRKMILRTVLQSLDGVVPDIGDMKDKVDEIIDMLVAHGDLLEHNEITMEEITRSEIILNRAPLSFVKRDSGTCVLLGIAPDDRPVLPDFLQEQIQYNNFTRMITAEAVSDISKYLSDLGFLELTFKAWIKCPPSVAPEKHIAFMNDNLMSSIANTTEMIEGVRILDLSTAVDYYPARWFTPNEEHTGRFIGRRPQAYGADLWCYIELASGKPRRFLDLPLPGSRWRGCDEAWYLQTAIDASQGKPQHYKIRDGASDYKIFELFSPIPSWAQRRWNMVGKSVQNRNCLLSFQFLSNEIEEEIRFAKEHLWLSEKI